MHPGRVIVHTEICSNSLSMMLYDPNIFTRQSPSVRKTPPGTHFTCPLHGILPGHGPILRYVYWPGIYDDVMIAAIALLLRQEPIH